jgi:hypothetical protein
MAEDKNTMIYLAGGGLLIALMFAMSKKASAATGGGNGLTRLDALTPTRGVSVGNQTTSNSDFKLRKVGAEANATPASFATPTSNGYVTRVKITTASGPLIVRNQPNTTSQKVYEIQKGALIDVGEYVKGASVYGNTNWYVFNGGAYVNYPRYDGLPVQGYFSAYYTDHPNPNTNYGGIDINPPDYEQQNDFWGRIMTDTPGSYVNVRSAANVNSSIVGRLDDRQTFKIDSKRTGPMIEGLNKNSTVWLGVSYPVIGYVNGYYVGEICDSPACGDS